MSDPGLKEALDDLAPFIDAARPYLDQFIFVGGWVPYFYRHLPELQVPDHDPILTRDFDVAAPQRMTLSGRRPLDRLLRDAEFVVISAMDPPILRYQHRRRGDKHLAPVHFEFLAPLVGRATDKRGRPRTLAEIQEGLQAQLLRHLDLLLHEPLEINTRRIPGLHVKPPASLRIPNPASYLIQKGLILDLRKGNKAAKDFAYVYEVALLWSGREPNVRAMVESLAGDSTLWARRVREGTVILARAFADESAEGPVSVAKEHARAGTTPAVSPKAVFRVVAPFLRDALGAVAH